jgi:prevent-host-death family protein
VIEVADKRGRKMSIEDLERVNMHEAKTHLSKLVERVQGGEEIVISRAGTPAAMLIPIETRKLGRRQLGGWEGKFELPSDEEWEQMDREIEQLFEESQIFPREDELWRGD